MGQRLGFMVCDRTRLGGTAVDLKLRDRTIFIAGASRGIGLGIADACLSEGARVAMTARGADALEKTCEQLSSRYGPDRVWSQAGDMRDSETIERAVDAAENRLGPIWGAVANVGLHP